MTELGIILLSIVVLWAIAHLCGAGTAFLILVQQVIRALLGD